MAATQEQLSFLAQILKDPTVLNSLQAVMEDEAAELQARALSCILSGENGKAIKHASSAEAHLQLVQVLKARLGLEHRVRDIDLSE